MLVLAIGIGVVNALIFEIFEAIVTDGQQLIWNDWLHTDERRWLVVPVAVILSILFSVVLKWLREPRWVTPGVNLELHIADGPKASLKTIGSILATGAAGLLAGASLGPEMPLTESAQGIGRWARAKWAIKGSSGEVIVAASIGALMVAFLGSMVMVLLPFLLIYKQTKKISLSAAVSVLLAGASAYGTLKLIEHGSPHSIPAIPPATLSDYAGTVVVSLLISVAALFLMRTIGSLARHTQHFHQTMPWFLSAGLFGLVLGGLYWLGGQPVQFSGSEGVRQLLADQAQYGAWAFLGLAIIKLLATAWSKTTGYRGGMFFPSIFVGVALSLFIGSVSSTLGGTGTMIGAIAAIFMALSIKDEPDIHHQDYVLAGLVALLFMLALLPLDLLPLATVAVITAALGNKLLVTWRPKYSRT